MFILFVGIADWFRPKWKHSNPRVRMAAVERLKEQQVLVYIARNDGESAVRNAAMERVTDRAVLADIGKNDEDPAVRAAALDRVIDQAHLAAAEDRSMELAARKAELRAIQAKTASLSYVLDVIKMGWEFDEAKELELAKAAAKARIEFEIAWLEAIGKIEDAKMEKNRQSKIKERRRELRSLDRWSAPELVRRSDQSSLPTRPG